MPTTETLLAFFAATALFAYMPGPALLYTAAQTVSRGQRAGFMAAAGIHLGCYVHVLAAAFGLSAVFAVVPSLYFALKLAGGLYLVFLGVQMIRTKVSNGTVPTLPQKSSRRAFVDSILVEVLNPKVAVFFIAFLPQFVSPEASLPIWAQFLVLGTVVNLAFTSADIVTVLFASQVKKKLARTSRFQDLTRWIGGSLLVGLGLKLATDRT
ncbi:MULTISPECIES: LysE family translocator [Stappiaceae]|uniref:LysE family translocator n=1 Tax=Stappiaceae TaxID=2821832 RepID=UPI00048FAB4A|nr:MULTISPECIES: LysE family translocator [Stappiaceae]MBG6144471.1 threonine/homoserine/homoserine lactone efflux protein [Labrenzia sp. EL_142]MBG6164458.1 threonine/homoserine/homoserine lactone efflux protein [Labrenzia sp. EL_195]